MSNEDKNKRLRDPFEECDISWLPKPSKSQTDAVKQNFRAGIRCDLCGAWHHQDVVHLQYVGHAAVTNRLLDVDSQWNWDFLCTNENGEPIVDKNGGMWITLTVNGVTRKGYGDAPMHKGADAMKERIGDAIRNAAMRFGVALELWHKGNLSVAVDHAETPVEDQSKPEVPKTEQNPTISDAGFAAALEKIANGELSAGKLKECRSLSDAQLASLDHLERSR